MTADQSAFEAWCTENGHERPRPGDQIMFSAGYAAALAAATAENERLRARVTELEERLSETNAEADTIDERLTEASRDLLALRNERDEARQLLADIEDRVARGKPWMPSYVEAMKRLKKSEADRDRATADLRAAEEARDALAQAMWDGWAALGFDTDGDTHPGAWIAGAGSHQAWAEQWLRDVRQHRKDTDEGDEETDAELDAANERLRALEAADHLYLIRNSKTGEWFMGSVGGKDGIWAKSIAMAVVYSSQTGPIYGLPEDGEWVKFASLAALVPGHSYGERA